MQKNNAAIYISIIVACLAAGGFLVWKNYFSDTDNPAVSSQVLPQITPTETPADSENQAEQTASPTPLSETQPSDASAPTEATPQPTPLALDGSDAYLKKNLAEIENGNDLLALLTEEEILRKVVRAVYGLSEGRVVREFRPVKSPSGSFLVQKTGELAADTEQVTYTIANENYARYTPYISLFSAMNNAALIQLYRFYLPTMETAYNELGVKNGNFHQTLLKAIDVLLATPTTEDALLLVQPSVMYKFQDDKFEKMPAAHKLMLRMGRENSEALKLELIAFKNRLLEIK